MMREGYVETNGVRLWYDDTGNPEGETIILIMGVDASVLWWPDELIETLQRARLVRFDNRDIGLSTHIDYERSPYTVDDMMRDTVGLMDSCQIRSAHFVAMSLGGVISQMLALEQPDRVRSLTLISSTPGPDERLSSADESVFADLDGGPPTTPDEWMENTVGFCRALSGTRFPFDEEYYRRLVAADVARGTNIHGNHGRLPWPRSRVDRLGDIRAPTLVVHGTEDPAFPFDHAETMAKGIPQARLVKWEGVGHELPPPLMRELGRLVLDHTRTTMR